MTTFVIGQKLEPGMFPIVEDIYRIDTSAKRKWFIIQSRAASEGRVVDALEEHLRCEGYCPKEKVWGKRDRNNRPTRRVQSLWPGYVFARIPSEGSFDAVRACDGVMRLVDRDGEHATVPDAWISEIRDREARGAYDRTRRRKERVRDDLGPFPDWVDVGELVRIEDGPFASFVGQITAATKLGRLTVETELFGRPTAMELELDQVVRLC